MPSRIAANGEHAARPAVEPYLFRSVRVLRGSQLAALALPSYPVQPALRAGFGCVSGLPSARMKSRSTMNVMMTLMFSFWIVLRISYYVLLDQ